MELVRRLIYFKGGQVTKKSIEMNSRNPNSISQIINTRKIWHKKKWKLSQFLMITIYEIDLILLAK